MTYESKQYISQPLKNGVTQKFELTFAAKRLLTHKISISIFNDDGSPAIGSPSGVLSGGAYVVGADKIESFKSPINIGNNERSYNPIIDLLDAIELAASGMDASQYAVVTITSISGGSF